MRGRTLHHGHVGAVLPQRRADVVRGIVGADHHHLLAGIGVRAGVLGRVLLLALEDVLALDLGHVGLARHAGGEHQVLGAQHQRLAIALHGDFPFLPAFVEAGVRQLVDGQ